MAFLVRSSSFESHVTVCHVPATVSDPKGYFYHCHNITTEVREDVVYSGIIEYALVNDEIVLEEATKLGMPAGVALRLELLEENLDDVDDELDDFGVLDLPEAVLKRVRPEYIR